MSDEAALLKAISVHADEDTPRLVYADWLDERGDHDRAEFIRVQCRLAAISPADQEWSALIDREADLVSRENTRPTSLPPPFLLTNVFTIPYRDKLAQFLYRGFPLFASSTELFEGGPASVADHLARLVANTTVRGVSFFRMSATLLSQLIDCPAFAEFRGLDVHLADPWTRTDPSRTIAMWKKLLATPAASRIEQFMLDTPLPPEVLSAFIASETFRGVRRYRMPPVEASPAEVREWLGAGWARNLRYVQAHLSNGPA
jgi:uncharacterized protein (TIGR02996 family)